MRLNFSYGIFGALVGVAMAAACSASSGKKSETGASGGTSGGGAGGSGGTSAGGGTGGTSTGGVGAGPLIDAGEFDDAEPPDAACSTVSESAGKPAVDIIWLVDSSCSMNDEIDKIRTNLNDSFVTTIDQSIIDWHMIMIASRGTTGTDVCVAEPVAGPNCADNPPKFHHVPCEIGSSDSLTVAVQNYGILNPLFCPGGTVPWGQLLRYEAAKVFVVVTDDEAGPPPFNWDAAMFDGWLLNNATPPGQFGSNGNRNYVFHGIIGTDKGNPPMACSSPPTDAGPGNNAVEPGLEYIKLAQASGGIIDSICEDDWSTIFNAIADGIVNRLECEYGVPPPADGGTIDPNRVNVKFTPGNGMTEDILQDNNADCDTGADGWQWNADETRILLCGSTCDRVKADLDGSIELEFGCETKMVPPPQ